MNSRIRDHVGQREFQVRSHDVGKVVEADRPVTVSGLPPSEQVQVFAIGPNGKEKWFAYEVRSLTERIRATHPFATMTEEEILSEITRNSGKCGGETT